MLEFLDSSYMTESQVRRASVVLAVCSPTAFCCIHAPLFTHSILLQHCSNAVGHCIPALLNYRMLLHTCPAQMQHSAASLPFYSTTACCCIPALLKCSILLHPCSSAPLQHAAASLPFCSAAACCCIPSILREHHLGSHVYL